MGKVRARKKSRVHLRAPKPAGAGHGNEESSKPENVATCTRAGDWGVSLPGDSLKMRLARETTLVMLYLFLTSAGCCLVHKIILLPALAKSDERHWMLGRGLGC